MRLARLGSFHQTRLSFMRVLLRRIWRDRWRFERRLFEIDARGVGRAVYTVHGPERAYSLVAFGHDLAPERRSDREIATVWDATFALHDGIPSEEDLDRLAANVPLQEAGRVSRRELCVSRANRSVRLFEHTVAALAAGRQPDPGAVADVGYLMRTTAVYGSGKLGAADHEAIADRLEFAPPFQAEMLTVWLIRAFALDLVERMAKLRAPGRARRLDPALRRRFGIGNSTGLGLAPFLLRHPLLINNWIAARETALARVRGQDSARAKAQVTFRETLKRARQGLRLWRTEYPYQSAKVAALRRDLELLEARIGTHGLGGPRPWDALWSWSVDALSLEGQELLVSLLLEPHGDLVDDLAAGMSAEEGRGHRLDGAMTPEELRALLERDYAWALEVDWTDPAATARAWYVSEEKLEPRLGDRWQEENIADYEQPLAPGRDAARLHADLLTAEDQTVAAFALRHPQHRHIIRRVQLTARFPYAEIRDNTIGAELMPIDMLRAKLAFFGANQFDPRSDRWVRINMYQYAPGPEEIGKAPADDWIWPPAEGPR